MIYILIVEYIFQFFELSVFLNFLRNRLVFICAFLNFSSNSETKHLQILNIDVKTSIDLCIAIMNFSICWFNSFINFDQYTCNCFFFSFALVIFRISSFWNVFSICLSYNAKNELRFNKIMIEIVYIRFDTICD